MVDDSWVAETYNHARHAEWAGDVDRCAAYLAELQTGPSRGPDLQYKAGPTDVLRWRAGELLQRMEHLPEAARPSPESIIETEQFRGVIRRLGSREFELRAYLKDFEFEEAFWKNAESLIRARHAVDTVNSRETSSEMPEAGMRNTQASDGEEEDDDPARGWWEATRALAMQVTISEFALLRIRAIWILPQAVQELAPVGDALQEVLRRFETGVGER